MQLRITFEEVNASIYTAILFIIQAIYTMPVVRATNVISVSKEKGRKSSHSTHDEDREEEGKAGVAGVA